MNKKLEEVLILPQIISVKWNPKNIKYGAALTSIGSEESYEKIGEKYIH
jgi:hypothetical protein